MKKLSLENISECLLERIPEFKKYSDFSELDEEEIFDLPYVLFGVFTRFYLEEFLKSNTELIKKINIFLEEISSLDEQESVSNLRLRELIAVGFLESLNENEDYYVDLVKELGPETSKLLKWIQDHNKKLANSMDPELKI